MTERQEAILRSVVEQYAEVASPVGSSLLAKVFGVSSATIRAEMAELERLGFIEQPHTSAGRVPTDKGYRFYVNHVADSEVLSAPATRAATEMSLSATSMPAGAVNVRMMGKKAQVASKGASSVRV